MNECPTTPTRRTREEDSVATGCVGIASSYLFILGLAKRFTDRVKKLALLCEAPRWESLICIMNRSRGPCQEEI
jgi:hypothetical protein